MTNFNDFFVGKEFSFNPNSKLIGSNYIGYYLNPSLDSIWITENGFGASSRECYAKFNFISEKLTITTKAFQNELKTYEVVLYKDRIVLNNDLILHLIY